jgi:hypothetical protein
MVAKISPYVYALAVLGCMTAGAVDEPMKIEVRRLPDATAATTKFLNPEYVVATPAAGKATDKTPLIIYLHGAGERGTDLTQLKSAPPIGYFNQQITAFPHRRTAMRTGQVRQARRVASRGS